MSTRVALFAAVLALGACAGPTAATPKAPPETTAKPQPPFAVTLRVAPSREREDVRHVEIDVTSRGGSPAAVFTIARAVDAEVGACVPPQVAALAPGQTTTIACDARVTGANPSFDLVAQVGARQQMVHVRLTDAAADGAATSAGANAAAARSSDAADARATAPGREVVTPEGQRIHVVENPPPSAP